MTTWVLIIYIYAGAMADGDSVTLTTITGFSSKETCEAAGAGASGLTMASTKVTRTRCVEVK